MVGKDRGYQNRWLNVVVATVLLLQKCCHFGSVMFVVAEVLLMGLCSHFSWPIWLALLPCYYCNNVVFKQRCVVEEVCQCKKLYSEKYCPCMCIEVNAEGGPFERLCTKIIECPKRTIVLHLCSRLSK